MPNFAVFSHEDSYERFVGIYESIELARKIINNYQPYGRLYIRMADTQMLFREIIIGNEKIKISPSSNWIVSEIQRTDAEGNLSVYYKTIIKALPRDDGLDTGHSSEMLIKDTGFFMKSYEFIYFETSERILLENIEYNEVECERDDDENRIITIGIGSILSFGKQPKEGLWKIQLCPKIVLYEFLTMDDWLKVFKRPKVRITND